MTVTGTVAAVGIGGGLITQGYFANRSSKKASKAAANAMDAYLAEMRRARAAAIGYQQPYEQAGRKGLDLLTQYLTGNPQDVMSRLEQTPGYQFRFSQGETAVKNLLAGRGGLRSGSAMKALSDYAQGTASQEFGNQVGYLQGLAGIGANAATTMSNVEIGAGTSMAEASQQGIYNQGMAMANRDSQMGNIIGSGLSQIGIMAAIAGAKGGGMKGKSGGSLSSTGGGTYNFKPFYSAAGVS